MRSPSSSAPQTDRVPSKDGRSGLFRGATFHPTASLPRHTEVTREQIRETLRLRGHIAFFVTPRRLNAARSKVSHACAPVRFDRPARWLYDESRWRLDVFVPISGVCGLGPMEGTTEDDLEAVFELARHARTHIAMLSVGRGALIRIPREDD